MKSLLLIALAAVSVAAFAQTANPTMASKKPPMQKGGKMDMMMGLTPAEKKVAMAHMAKMTSMEMGAHKHYMEQLRMGKTPKAAMMALGKSDQVTLKEMMAKMTPMEKKVAMKMMANARALAMKK